LVNGLQLVRDELQLADADTKSKGAHVSNARRARSGRSHPT
jgi:hypothetical protein